jgi:hypothetical protein
MNKNMKYYLERNLARKIKDELTVKESLEIMRLVYFKPNLTKYLWKDKEVKAL